MDNNNTNNNSTISNLGNFLNGNTPQLDLASIYGISNCDCARNMSTTSTNSFNNTSNNTSLETLAGYNNLPTTSTVSTTNANQRITGSSSDNANTMQQNTESSITSDTNTSSNTTSISRALTETHNQEQNQNMPITGATEPFPISGESLQYLNGFVRTQIGRVVTVEFLIGTNTLVDRTGTLLGVGANYLLINEAETDDITACDFYNIKFIKFYY